MQMTGASVVCEEYLGGFLLLENLQQAADQPTFCAVSHNPVQVHYIKY